MTANCPVCHAQQDAGLLCSACCDVLERELGDVAAIVADLDISLSKQARIGTPGKSGLARERMPINVGAIDPRWVLDNVLTTWARDVSETPADCTCDHADLPAHFHMTPCPIKVAHLARITLDRPIVTNPSTAAARLLLSAIPIIRRHPAVEELVDEITDAVHQARRAVDRPADKVYLGQCLVETPDDEGRMVTCLEEIYAHVSAKEVTCKVCGTEHPVGERRAWMLERAQETIVSVKEASFILGEAGGITISQASIRSYIHRQKLAYRAPVEAKRFRLGDLLAVVLDESERKSA